MNLRHSSREHFRQAAYEVGTSSIYLGGIAVIELIIRPLFGAAGVPLLVDLFLKIGEVTLLFGQFSRMIFVVDSFFKSLFNSWTVISLRSRLTLVTNVVQKSFCPYVSRIVKPLTATQVPHDSGEQQHEG